MLIDFTGILQGALEKQVHGRRLKNSVNKMKNARHVQLSKSTLNNNYYSGKLEAATKEAGQN